MDDIVLNEDTCNDLNYNSGDTMTSEQVYISF